MSSPSDRVSGLVFSFPQTYDYRPLNWSNSQMAYLKYFAFAFKQDSADECYDTTGINKMTRQTISGQAAQ